MPDLRCSHLLVWLLLILAGPRAGGLDLGRLDVAEVELEALVAEWRDAWEKGPDAATAKGLASSLQTLGMIERQAGKPDEALNHLETACELLAEHAPGLRADAYEAKAFTLQDLGELEPAETLLREVLEMRRKTTDRAKTAATYDHLALNLLYQGRYPDVGPLLDQAEAHSVPEQVDFRARVGSHRGRLLHTLGSYSRAAEAFKTALALPFQDPELRLALNSQLALSQLRLGKADEARAGTEAAAEQARKLFAAAKHRVVPYLNNLGAIYLAQNDPLYAKAAFSESLEMLEASFGPEHPGLIGPLNNLGVAEQELGDYESARVHLEQAAALQALHLPPTHLRVAETQRNLARNSLLSGAPDAREHIDRATRIGLELLDLLIREGTESERLNFLERFDLVSLPCATGDAALIADVLIASKARLLDAMLADDPGVAAPTWREIQAGLQPGTAFVDTVRFATTSTPPVWRYGAVVILPSGTPRWVPLGSDESLERWLAAFHKRLRWWTATFSGSPGAPPPLKFPAILRALEREFWAPLDLPAGIRHIAFSPDSRLHFLPLAALLDQQNRPLCTRLLQVSTVTSARDLLNQKPPESLASKPWAVISISDFPKATVATGGDPLLDLLADLTPMPGTKVESRKLRALAPEGSRFFSGAEATEAKLRGLSAPPSVLHLGCHAFYLQGTSSATSMPIDFDEHSELLFAGGLVLYRGTERQPGSPGISDHDDLLFPSEIASLPLDGTRLVTLSSCDSGAGTPVSGEGLLGLRRGFSLAGAREIAVALWPLSDASTPDFMERFYQLALASDRPAQALWQCQGEFLGTAKTDEEFELAVLRYAPFVLSQNAPLTVGAPIAPPEGLHAFRDAWRIALICLPLLLYVINLSVRKRRRA